MKREPVESSMIASIGYDANAETLEVEFNAGGLYQYEGVPKEVYEEFVSAESHGRYFLYNIRDAYTYRKVNVARRR